MITIRPAAGIFRVHPNLRFMSCDGSNVHWDFIRLAMSSVARYVLFPIQDIFGLDSSGRMNTPGTDTDNWTWRYEKERLNPGTAAYLKELSELFGRNQYAAEASAAQTKEDLHL